MVLTVKKGTYFVKFCTAHTSHLIEPEFLRVSNATKLELEAKLKLGITPKTILQSIRAKTDSTNANKPSITLKELENIAAKSGIGKEYQLNPDDGKSVDEFVKKDGGKTVILYKPVGTVDAKFPELNAKDFALALMNDQQRAILKDAMISPPGALMADATHGTNQYDLKLVTIMTINAFGNGMPVVFFFTTKEDQDAMEYLFTAIKSVIGNLEPKVCL